MWPWKLQSAVLTLCLDMDLCCKILESGPVQWCEAQTSAFRLEMAERLSRDQHGHGII